MVLKKKKTESEASHEHTPVVTQVVEVVEEDLGIPEDVKDSEQSSKIESIAEPPEFQEQHKESLPTRQDILEEENRHKETVAELFKRPTPNVMPEITVHKNGPRKKNPLMMLLVIIIIVAALGGGIFVAKGKSFSVAKLFMAAPTPTPTPAPTPTPTPQPVNRKDIKLQVLNGGGVPGAASKIKSFLEDKGYTVSDVSNAAAYTYTKTEVQVQPGKEAYQKLLMDDLKDTYSLATNAAALSADVPYDVRVVVGTK